MTHSSPTATLQFYRRDDCELCDEARDALQWVLEERARRGDPVPGVRMINLADQPALEAIYGARVPVIVVGDDELVLATSARSIGTFLDRTLGRMA